MIDAEEDLIHELGEWHLTYTATPLYQNATFYNCTVKWKFIFNDEKLN